MKAHFENLRVYRLAEQIADRIWEIAIGWDDFARRTVGGQIVRSADSIGANIAEGTGRGSYADNRRFVRTARGSLNETRHWLRRAFKRRLLTADHIEELKPLMDKLGPKLNRYLKSIGPVDSELRSGQPASDDRPGATNSGHETEDQGQPDN